MKKCKKCGAPLEGFLYNTIGKLMGLKPSANDPEVCNKCEEEKSETAPAKPVEEKPAMPAETPAAAEPETEKKEEIQS